MTTTRHRVVVNGVRRRVSRNDQFLRVANTVCTDDGRRLSNSPSATVAGTPEVVETTPTVSIAGSSGKEGNDDAIDFTVTLNEAASGTVTVDYATSDGSADADDDYTAKSGSLSFSAGKTSKTISVAIEDDSENETTGSATAWRC